MGRFFRNKLVALVLICAVSSAGAESTADDSIHCLPAPTAKKSTWRASAFAGCALLAVVGGVFAIFWSGGGNTPKHHHHDHDHHKDHHHRDRDCSPPCPTLCPSTVTADCMAGSCIYHENRNCGCSDGGWNGQQQVINGPPPCCSVNGGVPPF